MQCEQKVTASIVIYKEDPIILQKAVDSFISYPLSKKIYIVDNSPTNSLEGKIEGAIVEYIHSNGNIGFGSGHNSILRKIISGSDYHLILNPDVKFEPQILKKMIRELDGDENLCMIAPKVLTANKQLLYTAREYPTVFELIFRFLGVLKKFTRISEYQNKNLEIPFHPDFIQGGFMLFKTRDFILLQGFDERYFMYMEDVDICRRIDQSNKKKLYFPAVEIFHLHRKGSSKNITLFLQHTFSAIKYFMKWWFNLR